MYMNVQYIQNAFHNGYWYYMYMYSVIAQYITSTVPVQVWVQVSMLFCHSKEENPRPHQIHQTKNLSWV